VSTNVSSLGTTRSSRIYSRRRWRANPGSRVSAGPGSQARAVTVADTSGRPRSFGDVYVGDGGGGTASQELARLFRKLRVFELNAQLHMALAQQAEDTVA
jgi:hypothetical protein